MTRDQLTPSHLTGIAVGVLCKGDAPMIIYAGEDLLVHAVDATDFHAVWNSTVPLVSLGYQDAAAPVIADLNGDGCADIAMANLLLNADGGCIAQLDATSHPEDVEQAFGEDAFDVDGDGVGEVLSANAWYTAYGGWTMLSDWRYGSTVGAGRGPDGAFVVARARPTSSGSLGDPATHLRESDGTVRWSGALPEDTFGTMGFPAIGDVNGDGVLDIVVAGYNRLVALRTSDGSILWQVRTQDESSAMTNAVLYDFTGDGIDDVAYADETDFRIVDGPTGETIFDDPNHCSGTLKEQPLVADLDGDGSVEIVVAETECDDAPDNHGLVAYTSSTGTWFANSSLWGFSGWRESNGADDLGPVGTGDVSASATSNLRERVRTPPPQLEPVLDAWCTSGDQLVAEITVQNVGGTGIRATGLELSQAGLAIATTTLDAFLEPGQSYGPVQVEIPASASEDLTIVVLPVTPVCAPELALDPP